ncbi:hypothetical protein E8A45_15895 [Salmonella enterica]|nr:hypothetical protein [Salmonella enterica]EBW1589822.1 hypothetical protein [Salmonella enterica subsp. diarizonae serovar 61:r:z]EDR7604176.1 hypothetical protein [Salmonella enterica subsp. diarizonae]EAT8025621.1 hypothetical protein [Salmonella enterica]EBB6121494.1 hypothetical protein [Salmonella enterica]
MQRAEGVTAHVGLRAISVSSVNRKNWRLRTNGSRCYPVGAGKMQAVRADSETAVVWLSARSEAEQGSKGCFARRKRHEREQAKQTAQSGMA